MHLCFALIALLTVLLPGTVAKSKQECQVFGVLIHYFVLASFLWMGVEGINMYLCFVKILRSNNTKLLWKASAFAWGKLPFLPQRKFFVF